MVSQVTERKTRLAYLDNIKVVLTILVVVHHVAITYGSRGSWYYYEHSDYPILNEVLSFFTGMNQNYFMGFFFLIAGFFTPASYDRKGFGLYLKDRFFRLGIPLLVCAFTVIPALEYIKCITNEKLAITFWEFYSYNTLHFRNIPTGPMWFVEALLIFSCVYAILRVFLKKSALNLRIRINYYTIGTFVAILASVTFLMRVKFPMGYEFHNFQLAYFPQYICMFAAGIFAWRSDAFAKIPVAFGKVGILAVVLSVALMEGVGATSIFGDFAFLNGGLHWQSLVMSVYQAVFCTGISLAAVVFFQQKCNKQWLLMRSLAKNSYAIYIIHAPIVVLLAYTLSSVAMHPLIKFGIVSVLGLTACLLISQLLIRRIPVLKKIL